MSEREDPTPEQPPPTTPGKPMSWPEVASFVKPNGKRAPDRTMLTAGVTVVVALCGMVAAILVPVLTGRQQMALTMAILTAQREQAVAQAEAAAKLVAITDETKTIAQKVDGRLTAALDSRATALEQVASMKPGNIVAKTKAEAARKEAAPPPETAPK